MACEGQCTKKGMVVLPVRYAVVPETSHCELPGWANDARVTSVPLENKERYALRALRQGYLYVFYEKGAEGTNYWQCYSVSEDGSLWLQTVAFNPAAIKEPACQSSEHVSHNVEFMCIESPEECGLVWFAFSQYPWCQETLDRYKSDSTLRARRMQKINPRAWIHSRSTSVGTEATETALNEVLDYQLSSSIFTLLPGPDWRQELTLSYADDLWEEKKVGCWRVNEAVLKQQSSLYAWADRRTGFATATMVNMKARGMGIPGLILPLWDAIGITHELNGWCQEVLGKQVQFIRERELEMWTKTNLDALKGMLGDKAQANLAAMRNRMADDKSLSPENLAERRKSLRIRYANKPEVLAQGLSDCDLLESWRGRGVTASHVHDLMMDRLEPLATHQKKVAALKAKVEQEAVNYLQISKKVYADSWTPYNDCLKEARLINFNTCYKALTDKVNELFQQRVRSVLNWLSAPLLLDTLDDFCCAETRAGVFYQSAVTMALNGINSCPAGAAKLDGWWNEYSGQCRENLLWRHVTANKPALISELEPLLATVKAKQDETVTPFTGTTVTTTLLEQAGSLKKLSSYYQKSLKSVTDGLRENASKLEMEIFKADAFVVTVGDRISRALRVDKAGEKLSTTAFRLVFLVRAGIPVEKARTLVNEYLRDAPALRESLLESFRHSKRFMPSQSEVTTIRRTLSDKLEEHFATEKGQQEYRLARINGFLLIVNAMDFIYLCGQFSEDKKPLSSLAASGFATVYQATQVFLPAIEKGLAATPHTVAWLKGAGAAAGMTASGFLAYADSISAYKEFENNQFFLGGVLTIKTVINGLGAVKSLGLLLEVLGTPRATRAAGKISGFLAAEFLGIRIFAILLSWEAMVFLTLLQAVGALVSDNELQLWCKMSVFGTEPKKRALAEQKKTLEAAVKEIA